tara:strand:+ start:678 stop:953 length:276 start_codon:yes stop_codon:yes gene_type:complete
MSDQIEKMKEYQGLQDDLLLALSKEAGYHQAILDVMGFLKTAKICHDAKGSVALKRKIKELEEQIDYFSKDYDFQKGEYVDRATDTGEANG